MPEATINGHRMHYEMYGKGQPLVMIHGGLGGGEGCAQMVQHHADTLSRRFRLIFYDRRGAGLSETPAEGYSIENYARDLHGLLTHLEIDRAHILGSSAGGPIALRFALDHPEMTGTLMLVNTMTYCQESERALRQRELDQFQGSELVHGREITVTKALDARWPGLRRSQPERFESLRQANIAQFDGLAPTIQSYLDIQNSLEDRLDELKMPTLVIHGDADSRISVECGRQLHQGIAGSQLHILPGAEHGLLTNEAKTSRDLILNFLSQREEGVRAPAD